MENTPKKMICGNTNQEQEEIKEAGPPCYPVVHGELPSSPQWTTQQSTTNSVIKRSAAAVPAAADDGEDDIRAEKTKKSPMATQISTSWSE